MKYTCPICGSNAVMKGTERVPILKQWLTCRNCKNESIKVSKDDKLALDNLMTEWDAEEEIDSNNE